MSTSVTRLQDSSPVFYYLHNFRCAVGWILERYGDLLSHDENTFIEEFNALPLLSQALLVRLIMRKGQHFRAAKIDYPEIGSPARALGPLIDLQWIDPRPLLGLSELFRLATRVEISAMFPDLPRGMLKVETLALLQRAQPAPRSFEEWRGSVAEPVYFVTVAPLCTKLKLLFFGNFRQEWSEFVLADLGIFKYESVRFAENSRAFQTRKDVEDFLTLYECRRGLRENAPLAEVLAHVPQTPLDHEWLESRRAKLIFQIARAFERCGECGKALDLYTACRYPGSRFRAVRSLEMAGRDSDAYQVAVDAAAAPESAAEAQRLARVLARLKRRLKLAPDPKVCPVRPERLDLIVPAPRGNESVEHIARAHLAKLGAPVYYVENGLINSLFGLLCWDAIFAPVSGAFFHPFHVGPADLFSPTFRARRGVQFDLSLASLETQGYRTAIVDRYREKQGIQSPFVSWGLLSEKLLHAALACIPGVHLRRCFERLLSNLHENRNGLPDLIQFCVIEKRYRMIEVKGPGDRLQDNQQRWMQFCLQHGIPVAVCHVRWA